MSDKGWFTLSCVILAASLLFAKFWFYNQGQKDALRGQQKYKMEIHYRYEVQSTHIEPNNDSSTILYQLVPFDTTFVKK
jgi:hypothetical protein